MKKKIAAMMILCIVLISVVGGICVAGSHIYDNWKMKEEAIAKKQKEEAEEQWKKEILAENKQTYENFYKEKARAMKLEILKELKESYQAYRKEEIKSKLVNSDYQDKIGEMEDYFLKSYEEKENEARYNTANEDEKKYTLLEKKQFIQKRLEELLDLAESEKEVLGERSTSFRNELKGSLENYKKKMEVIKPFLQFCQQTVTNEEVFYEEYVRQLKLLIESDVVDMKNEELEISYVIGADNDYETYGYLIRDLDGDGIKELILGGNSTENGEHTIYSIYSVEDSKFVYVAEGWERSRYYLCKNGMIGHEGAYSGSHSCNVFYEYKDNKLVPIYEIESVGDYQSSSYKYRANRGPTVRISKTKKEEISNQYPYEEITFTPFPAKEDY